MPTQDAVQERQRAAEATRPKLGARGQMSQRQSHHWARGGRSCPKGVPSEGAAPAGVQGGLRAGGQQGGESAEGQQGESCRSRRSPNLDPPMVQARPGRGPVVER